MATYRMIEQRQAALDRLPDLGTAERRAVAHHALGDVLAAAAAAASVGVDRVRPERTYDGESWGWLVEFPADPTTGRPPGHIAIDLDDERVDGAASVVLRTVYDSVCWDGATVYLATLRDLPTWLPLMLAAAASAVPSRRFDSLAPGAPAAAEVMAELGDAAVRIAAAREALRATEAARDRLVVEAMSGDVPPAAVAGQARVSRPRLYQIVRQ